MQRRKEGTSAPPVPASLYSAETLRAFAAGEHEQFLAAGGRPLRPRLARSLALAALEPGLVVADVGSGRGEAAAHSHRRGAIVIAVDYSLQALRMACETVGTVQREARQQHPAPWLALAADATALPIATAAVDRVLLLDIIEHLHPWQVSSLLDEVRRILRPSGYVVIHTLPNRWALAAAYPLLRLWAWRLPADARSRYERAVHVNEQDPLGLRRTLQRAGLTARVWVEEWTTVYAARGRGRDYPDRTRSEGYEVLRSSTVQLVAGAAMRTPARWFVGNDLFALAWKPGHPGPPATGRFAPLRRSLAVSAPRSRRGVR